MKKISLSITNASIYSLILFLFALQVNATVGGPSYVGSLKYNNADESVYFINNSESGRGCPPVLNKISLVSEITSTAISCDEGEALLYNPDNLPFDDSKLYQEINQLTANASDLTPISLPKNNIVIDLIFIREEKISGDDYPLKNHFLSQVYQNGEMIDEFPITGCNMEQPFIFAGYAIPGFEKKIIIVSSAKSDCTEGGYIEEHVFVIGGVNQLNRTHTGDWKSERGPLILNEGSLVVYENDTLSQTIPEDETNNSPDTFSTRVIILFILALVIGISIGVLVTKFRRG